MLFTAEFETNLPIQEIGKVLRFGSFTADHKQEVGIHYRMDGVMVRGIIVSNSEDRLYKITSGFLKIRKLYNHKQTQTHMIFKAHLIINTAQEISDQEAIGTMFWADRFPNDIPNELSLNQDNQANKD